MKTKILIFLIITLLAITGCTSADNEEQAKVDGVDEATIEDKLVPDRKAEVAGVIKSIIGNEVTISLLEKSNTANTSEEGIELTEEEKAAKQAENQAARESGGEGGQSSMTDIELSGETIDIIIPVGTTVVKSSGVGDGEFITLNIGDIYKGDSVKIWIRDGGELEVELAEFVQVLTQQ